MAEKRTKRKPGYTRNRASQHRLAQSLWRALRSVRKPITAADLAARSGASEWTARHLLYRWGLEGLAVCVCAQERSSAGQLMPARWTLGRDIGKIAPVLRGTWRDGRGIFDPNA